MSNHRERLKQLNISSKRLTVTTLALAAFILVFWWLFFTEKNNYLEVDTSDGINVTPEQIQSIKEIGQWEFLSISDEELVDTTRKRLFADDQLVRIYYGTLRLGIDMHDAQPDWLQARGDTVTLTLPPVKLLDQNFIDEARTKSFYESGKWKGADLELLYRKAHRMMLAHGLTPENLRQAEDNADTQFRRMMKAMGFQTVIIRFSNQ